MRFWTHKRVSILKSSVRIKACVLAALMPTPTLGVIALALGMGVAEVLGVWEEMGGRG